MSVRFRIRTSAGQELSFASHEMFEDFVRSGELSPDDLVYDGDTASWAPARTHPLVLEIEYEKEETDAAAAASGTGADEGLEESNDAIDPLSFDLAPIEEKAPSDESRAFVEKLEAEREADLDFGGSHGAPTIEGLTSENSGSLAGMLKPVPAAPRPPPTPPRPEPAERAKRPERSPRRSHERSAHTPATIRREGPDSSEPKGSGAGRWVGLMVVAAGLGGLAYVGYGALGPQPFEATGDGPELQAEPAPIEPVPPRPTPEPVIAATETAIRARARERFLTNTQIQLRDLQPVPDAWAGGQYLAMPTEYPEVVDVWQSYVATIRAVRAGDRERYRLAYVAALDDAAIEGGARVARLSGALKDFDASREWREAHFGRVEALATAAIQSHNALVEAEGLILYDPGSGGAELGAGTTARDADAQLLLDQVLDLLTSTLDAGGLGPHEGARVREWVWDGFLDAVAR